jgi:very-short-patch-repair endonuclease
VIDPAARARLERWKLSLLDLSAGNRLLDSKDGKTTIPLLEVDAGQVAAALADGAAFTIASRLAPAGDAYALRTPLAKDELARRLTAIRRAARGQLADGGVHTLWLGLGMLTWCEADEPPPDGASDAKVEAIMTEDTAPHPGVGAIAAAMMTEDTAPHPLVDAIAASARRAPLVLWPVELERELGGGVRLALAPGLEPRLNLTLAEKLRRSFGVVLPAGDGDELDLAAVLAAAEAIAVTRPGWRLERAAQLGVMSFAKFVMWNDLDARADELIDSPIVAHLARGVGVAFAQPSVAASEAVAATTAAAEILAPLDADASQIAAIAAAGAGASFVLQGPPGTGKSQTIANLIVHCVTHGKTVLFVTDKRAALEVVQQRLAAVGLGEFCLELHSHKAVRGQVVTQLGRVLERAFRPVSGPSGNDDRLTELRAALDDHVTALHRVGPFGRSLHDALGRLIELRSVPRAALAERDATGLDGQAFERRKRAVSALAGAALPVEPVATHPWRASAMARWPLDGRERALAALDEAAAAAEALAAAVAAIAGVVPGIAWRTRDQLEALGALAGLAAGSPRPGGELLTQIRAARGDELTDRIALIRARGAGSIEVPRDPGAFLALASRHRALVAEVHDRFTDAVAGLDAPGLWSQLRRWTHRMAPLRFLALRDARAALDTAALPCQLETDDARIAALEAVIAERAARAALDAAAEPARRWFGALGGDPLALDLAKIDAAVSWAGELRRAFDAIDVGFGDAGRAAAWRALVAQVAASPESGASSTHDLAKFTQLADAVARWRPALAQLAETTGVDAVTLGAGDDHLSALGDRIDALRHALDGMRDWVAFHAARQAALAAGVGPAVAAIERGDLGASELAAAWERATLLAWADAELADTPALARFHGAAHHAHVAAFADLDRAALALVRARALVRLAERVPRVTADPGGELGVLLHEVKKQRGHRPLRRLFAEIPNLLPRLAPCLLMSPLSVAQYLDPALPKFDVVVFDEASQLPTADAIGALARGDAAVVVGDSQQLPPTRFFAVGDGGDETVETVDLESVLDECVAQRLPELRLAWHYRSRHEDLIAFANQHYYGDRLQVFPAAQRSPDLGVSWRKVEGVYDRAGTRQNVLEAEAVVHEVLARLRDPAQRARSIGVVTFSRAQQAAIEDLFDAARADDPDLDAWFEPSPAGGEPVVVKNLETMQGDERDVVILSVGYGPDATGALALNFGPLSQRGGERRLNVAITRAREQLIVVSSFTPETLSDALTAASGQGVRDLAALLAFARAGGGAARPIVDEVPEDGDAGARAASPITAAIARALGERGWIVRHQIGCGAYKIDLAVVDPNDPERYVLAIEHDGAAYASAPAARDRDRLRAQVLGQLGWRLHRIWSLDWWADPEREIQRAHGAIVAAVAAARRRAPVAAAPAQPPRAPGRPAPARPATPPALAARARLAPAAIAAGSGPTDAVAAILADASSPTAAAGSAPIRIGKNTIAVGPYLAAAIPAGRRAPDDLFAARHLPELGKIIEQVLAAEAPMHVDLLARRVGAYFGIGRLTQRVSDQVRTALAGRGRFGDETDIVWRLDQDPTGVPAVRVAGQGASARREIDEVPLSEIAAAARIVVERAVALAANDLVRDSARLLGFARITDRVLERVATGVRLAAQRTLIRLDAGKAVLPD